MGLRSMLLGLALAAGGWAPVRAQSVGRMLEYDVKNGIQSHRLNDALRR